METTHDFVIACSMLQEQVALGAHYLNNCVLTRGTLQSILNERV